MPSQTSTVSPESRVMLKHDMGVIHFMIPENTPDVKSSSPGLLGVNIRLSIREEGGEMFEILFRHPFKLGSGIAGLDGDTHDPGLGLV